MFDGLEFRQNVVFSFLLFIILLLQESRWRIDAEHFQSRSGMVYRRGPLFSEEQRDRF
jgi:hypothetical protein